MNVLNVPSKFLSIVLKAHLCFMIVFVVPYTKSGTAVDVKAAIKMVAIEANPLLSQGDRLNPDCCKFIIFGISRLSSPSETEGVSGLVFVAPSF
jgi:hypothetical protein